MQTVSTIHAMRIASIRKDTPESLGKYSNQSITHLAIPTSDGLHMLSFDEIMHCQADSNYCIVNCRGNQRVVVSKPLKAIEALLPEGEFVRIHQSHVIRLCEVRFVQKDQVMLSNGNSIPLARSHKSSFADHLLSFTVQL